MQFSFLNFQNSHYFDHIVLRKNVRMLKLNGNQQSLSKLKKFIKIIINNYFS